MPRLPIPFSLVSVFLGLTNATDIQASFSNGNNIRHLNEDTATEAATADPLIKNFQITKNILTSHEQESIAFLKENLRPENQVEDDVRYESAIALAVYYYKDAPDIARSYLSILEDQQYNFEEHQTVAAINRFLSVQLALESEISEHTDELERLLQKRHLPLDLKKTCHELLMKHYAERNFNSKFIFIYESYKSSIPQFSLDDRWIKKAAIAYKASKENQKYFNSLEILAARFPQTVDSEWAFEQLESASKLDQKHGSYSFSLNFIRRLYLNTSINPSYRLKILEQLERPIRTYSRSRPKMITPSQKIKFLMRLGEYKGALAFATNDLRHSSDPSLRKQSFLWEAHALCHLGEYDKALELFTKEKKAGTRFTYFFNESYAKTLMHSEQYEKAAEQYRKLLVQRKHYRTRWYLFWNLMKSEQIEKATAILKDKEPIFHPSRIQHSARSYWMARLHPGQIANFNKAVSETHQYFYRNFSLDKQTWAFQNIDSKQISIDSTSNLNLKKTQWPPNNFLFDTNFIHASARKDENKLSGSDTVVADSTARQEEYTWARAPEFEHLPYKKEIDIISKNMGIDPLLVLALMKAESGFNPKAFSEVGAQGIMQLMPYTAIKLSKRLNDQSFTVKRLSDPVKSILYGTTYLSMLERAFEKNLILTIAAYNAGPLAIQQWLRHCRTCQPDEFVELIPYKETRNYVKKVLSFYTKFTKQSPKLIATGSFRSLPEIKHYEDLF